MCALGHNWRGGDDAQFDYFSAFGMKMAAEIMLYILHISPVAWLFVAADFCKEFLVKSVWLFLVSSSNDLCFNRQSSYALSAANSDFFQVLLTKYLYHH